MLEQLASTLNKAIQHQSLKGHLSFEMLTEKFSSSYRTEDNSPSMNILLPQFAKNWAYNQKGENTRLFKLMY